MHETIIYVQNVAHGSFKIYLLPLFSYWHVISLYFEVEFNVKVVKTPPHINIVIYILVF